MSLSIKLNKKQSIAMKLMIEGKSVFLTGPGGVGKTALIKYFWQQCHLDKNIAITSTTGTSALLIQGTTIHSYLGIGTGTGTIESIVMKINKTRWLRDRWIALKCLVIDEISMLDPDIWDKLENIARIIRHSIRPWGGIQLVISGDFLQLPCVGTDKFCFQAKSWDQSLPYTIYLTEIIRQKDQLFQRCLNSIRLGDITQEVSDTLLARVGAPIVNKYNIIPTKLYSTNNEVDYINNIELDKLATEGRQFYEYTMEFTTDIKYIFIEKFKKNCNAQEIVQLCLGAQVILLKNLDIESGLVNGSRGVITKFHDDTPIVTFLNGIVREIEIATWDVMENEKCILSMTQIPLKAAYAISIHKSQGCTLDCVEIDLANIFEYGQSYVALSRAKSLEGLSLTRVSLEKIMAHPLAVEYYSKLREDYASPGL
jgi:ATP-dependent DNA helicase PIF1